MSIKNQIIIWYKKPTTKKPATIKYYSLQLEITDFTILEDSSFINWNTIEEKAFISKVSNSVLELKNKPKG